MFKKSPKNQMSSAFLLIFMLTFLIQGCSNPAYTIRATPLKHAISRYVVFPFKSISKQYDSENSDELTNIIHKNAEASLFENFLTLAKEQYRAELIPSKNSPPYPEFILQREKLERNSIFIQKGQSNNAHGVVLGRIFRYKERVGGAYSIQQPASIAFELLIFDTQTGQLIWKAQYDETQQPLSENLFQIGTFLKRKGQWITAEEMMISALKEILKHFPKP